MDSPKILAGEEKATAAMIILHGNSSDSLSLKGYTYF